MRLHTKKTASTNVGHTINAHAANIPGLVIIFILCNTHARNACCTQREAVVAASVPEKNVWGACIHTHTHTHDDDSARSGTYRECIFVLHRRTHAPHSQTRSGISPGARTHKKNVHRAQHKNVILRTWRHHASPTPVSLVSRFSF